MKIKLKFSKNLQNLRKTKKLSQEKLAEKIGVSRQSVSKWQMNNILILCKIFDCRLNDLLE